MAKLEVFTEYLQTHDYFLRHPLQCIQLPIILTFMSKIHATDTPALAPWASVHGVCRIIPSGF
jgi:hypothetical protein